MFDAYRRLDFETEEGTLDDFNPERLHDYHDIILAPFLVDGPFDFGDWNPTMEAKAYILSHPSMFKLVPPKDALLYFRVIQGMKGLLTKLDASVDVRSIAEATARRRGLV